MGFLYLASVLAVGGGMAESVIGHEWRTLSWQIVAALWMANCWISDRASRPFQNRGLGS